MANVPRQSLPPFSEFSQFVLDAESIRMLPLPYCVAQRVVVLGTVDRKSRDRVVLGMLDPKNEGLVMGLSASWGRPVTPVQITSYDLERALKIGFKTGNDNAEADHEVDMNHPELKAESTAGEIVDDILLRAVCTHASDVHIECYRTDVDVRLRIDGVLHQVPTPLHPNSVRNAISRLKVLANLDISEHRRPQDGRFRLSIRDGDVFSTVDVRVSTLPGPFGEDAVLRLLNSQIALLPLTSLGLSAKDESLFSNLLKNPEGFILVTGPTGSGKTTTLYAALNALRDGKRKIVTAEDPIEYYLEKVNQKQVSDELEIADIAKAFLRQDPDIILIGEIRDQETAVTAAQAAATGHLVLGTLHTADALGAIPRLRGLGLDDEGISNSLLAVVSQRLLRRICVHCKEEAPISEEHRTVFGSLVTDMTGWHGRGCGECRGSGYAGRAGVYEILFVDEALVSLIAEGAPVPRLRQYLRETGFTTLTEDAVTKAAAGITTLEEIVNIIPFRDIQMTVRDRDRGKP